VDAQNAKAYRDHLRYGRNQQSNNLARRAGHDFVDADILARPTNLHNLLAARSAHPHKALPIFIIRIDNDGRAFWRKLGKEPRLGHEIIFSVRMIIKMILG